MSSRLKGSWIVIITLALFLSLLIAVSVTESLLSLVPLLVAYGGLVFEVKYEAGIILDQCIRSIGENPLPESTN